MLYVSEGLPSWRVPRKCVAEASSQPSQPAQSSRSIQTRYSCPVRARHVFQVFQKLAPEALGSSTLPLGASLEYSEPRRQLMGIKTDDTACPPVWPPVNPVNPPARLWPLETSRPGRPSSGAHWQLAAGGPVFRRSRKLTQLGAKTNFRPEWGS